MKKAFLFILFLFAIANSFAQSVVYVHGYTRSNGTYVQGYYRTAKGRTFSCHEAPCCNSPLSWLQKDGSKELRE